MLAAIAAAAFFMCFAMTIAWAIQRRTGNSGWIDTVWSFAVGAAAFFLALVPAATGNSLTNRQLLVAALVAVWLRASADTLRSAAPARRRIRATHG